MRQQLNNKASQAKTQGAKALHILGVGKGVQRYKNVCSYCDFPNTNNLIKIKRAGGDIHLCQFHAKAAGVL